MSRFVLDCAVRRPVDDQAVQWLATATRRAWASPTGGYHEAKTSQALLDQSEMSVAALFAGRRAWFTADLTEAVRSAASDAARSAAFEGLATSAVDPVVVIDQTRAVAGELGLPHLVVDVDSQGRLDPSQLPGRTLLVTSAANQEIGAVQADLGAWAMDTGSAVVLEASAAFGWVDVPTWWSHLVVDPRAWGAPGGVAVVVSRQAGTSPGFDDVPAAVTAGLVGQRWQAASPAARRRTGGQVQRIREAVLCAVPHVEVHGGGPDDLPHVLSLSVLHVDAEVVQSRLDALGFAVGSGSACASRSGQPSHVLAAIGGLTSGNVRLGLPPDLPDEAVTGFVDAFVEVVGQVRSEMGTEGL